MKMIISRLVSATVGLAIVLVSTGGVQAGFNHYQPDIESLSRWQSTYDGLRDMNPKWGKQGVQAFKAILDAGAPVQFIDVRTPSEWKSGIIKDALLINLNKLTTPASLARLPRGRQTIIGIYCKAGHRSTLAMVFLHQLGYKNTISMSGGMSAWRNAGYPVEHAPGTPSE